MPPIPMSKRDLLFLDVETSGLDVEKHEIIELAAVRTPHAPYQDGIRPDGWKYLERRTRMVHPGSAEPEALKINGYDPAAWARHAVDLRVALVELQGLLGWNSDSAPVIVGVNPFFDLGFITAGLRREGLKIQPPRYVLDVASMAWPLVVRGDLDYVNLDTLCKRYGVDVGNAHTAMGDVRRTIAVYRRMMGR